MTAAAGRRRLVPTARELDEATADHPVFVLRGGQVGAANSRALQLAGAEQTALLERECRLYNSRGIGVVRDPGLVPEELGVYQRLLGPGG